MLNAKPLNIKQQLYWMMLISVAAWLGFLLFFRSFWPGNTNADSALTVLWLWLAIGFAGSALTAVITFRLFSTPPQWRPHAAAALTAPAMCLDTFGTIFFERWFPNPGTMDDRIYPVMILAGVAAILFTGLWMGRPGQTTD
ncbi:MAG: DUF5367 family protein [Gammaproteobacteria bacterium]|nr:DUF5367 family protein [Gammaproteobacteria bacterium]